MAGKCEVEIKQGTERLPEPMAGTGKSLIQRIFERDDVLVVAGGSLSCLRSLYLEAVRAGKVAQLIPCLISPAEYACGKNLDRILACAQQAVNTPGTAGVVIYVSCVEFLSCCDFDTLLLRLHNPGQVSVQVLFRGPMAKRTVNMGQRLTEILNTFPEARPGARAEFPARLPVPAPDFEGMEALLSEWGQSRFLVTGGGCAGCIQSSGKGDRPLKYSRMDDVMIAMGCEKRLEDAIARAYAEEDGPLYLMGSAISSFASVDLEWVAGRLQKRGLQARYLESTGWGCAPEAMERLWTEAAEHMARQMAGHMARHMAAETAEETAGETECVKQTQGKQVRILGYSGLSTGALSRLNRGIMILAAHGCQAEYFRPGMGQAAVYSWVVSAEALPAARLLWEACGIPYGVGIPIGSAQEKQWLDCILKGKNWELSTNGIVEKGVLKQQTSVRRAAGQQRQAQSDAADSCRLLVTGEPVLTARIAQFLEEVKGVAAVRASYAPDSGWERTVKRQMSAEDWMYYQDGEQLKQAVSGVKGIIADPSYRYWRDAHAKGLLLLPLPYGILSGSCFDSICPELFGAEAEAWIARRENWI